jgi:hypothetical protein
VEEDKEPGEPPDVLMIDLLFVSVGVVLLATLGEIVRRRLPFMLPG